MDTQQQQALNVLRGLLPTLPVIDYSIPGGQIEIPLNVQSPQGYNELARVTRVGPNAWEVSISGMAEMNCTDLECVINFLSSYPILGVETNDYFVNGNRGNTNYFMRS